MKNYREKIEKYRKNEMMEEEAEDFEKELSDFSAIFDYLMENEEIIDFSHNIESEDILQSEQIVKKKIRKRMFRLVVGISLIVLLVVGSILFIVPKVIDSINYNPVQGQVLSKDGQKRLEEPSNFELYNRIENQIFPEGDRLVATSIDRVDPGKYSIQKEFYNDFRGVRSATQEIMDRGKIEPGVSDSTNKYSLIYGGKKDLIHDEIVSDDSVLNSKIALLPDSSWVKVTLTFTEAKNWTELQEFIQKQDDVVFHSALIDSGVSALSEIGVRFSPQSNDNLTEITALPVPYSKEFVTKIEDDYPELLSQITQYSSETQVKSFLKSNISYLIDHMDDNFYEISLPGTEETASKEEQLESVRENIEKEDFLFSKVQVSFPKKMFTQFVNKNDFFYATLDDLSLFN